MTLTIFLGSLLLAMAIGIPISFALLVCGVALMWHLGMFEAQILAQNLLGGADNYPLLAVPFFLLAGEIMNEGGCPSASSNSRWRWSATSAAAWAT
jgi:TRAP-type mannitol/chloroaromatic compound transport system permease large subunit